MTKVLTTIIFGVILAVMIHIGILLFAPQLSLSNAWDTLVDQLEPFQVYPTRPLDLYDYDPNPSLPPRPSPEEDPFDLAIREVDPAFDHALCRFHLRTGPVHLRTINLNTFWSVNVFSFGGISFFSTTEQVNGGKPLDVLVTTAQQLASLRLNNAESLANMVVVETDIEDAAILFRVYDQFADPLPQEADALGELLGCAPFDERAIRREREAAAEAEAAAEVEDAEGEEGFEPISEE